MASSTYLQLVNKVLQKVNEVELTDTTFASARGVHAAAKEGVKDAVQKIYTYKKQWNFNKTTGTEVLAAGSTSSGFPADLKEVDWDTFYIIESLLFEGNKHLKYIDKDQYFRYLRAGDMDHPDEGLGVPDYVFKSNAFGFGVTPVPDQSYIVQFDYWMNTIDLVTYDDTTSIPDLYDYVIVQGAMIAIWQFFDNAARADKAEEDFTKGLNFMADQRVPSSEAMSVVMVNQGGGRTYGIRDYLGN